MNVATPQHTQLNSPLWSTQATISRSVYSLSLRLLAKTPHVASFRSYTKNPPVHLLTKSWEEEDGSQVLGGLHITIFFFVWVCNLFCLNMYRLLFNWTLTQLVYVSLNGLWSYLMFIVWICGYMGYTLCSCQILWFFTFDKKRMDNKNYGELVVTPVYKIY